MRILYGILKGMLIASMIGIALTTGIGVVFRYVLNSPLYWTDEISRYALIWMTFLGGALLVAQSDGHVRVDFFTNRMSGRWRRVAVGVSTAVEAAIALLVTAGGLVWMQASGRAASAAVGIPMPLVYAVIPLSGMAALAFILCRCVSIWKAGSGER